MDFGVLLQEGDAALFPPQLLRLAVNAYLGPRYARAHGAKAAPVFATRGIMPGCALAMGVLHVHLRTV
eukprot:9848095-Lingulodinium_polyedra.AAC.1